MKHNWKRMTIVVAVSSLLLTACSESDSPEPVSLTAPVVEDNFGVIAEGQLTPRHHVDMAFSTAGRVVEVTVEEGDTVRADQLLARLENEPQMRAAIEKASSNAQQASSNAQQASSVVEQARSGIEQGRSGVEQAKSGVEQARSGVEQARSNVELAGYNLSQTALEIPQITLELAQAGLESIIAQQTLDSLYDKADTNVTSIQADVAQAQAQLEEAERRLIMIDKPDVVYYQNQITEAENLLLRLGNKAEIIKIGSPTDAVDRARDFLDDEAKFLDKVKKASEGCNIDVDSGDHTKLVFSEDLNYRSDTYNAGGVYDVPDWIAEELLTDFSLIVSKATLSCDPERDHTVDGRTVSVEDAQEDYDDAVTKVEEAENQLALVRLENEQAIRDTDDALRKAKRNLAWVNSGKYSKQAIEAAEDQSDTDLAKPQSVEVATLLAEADVAAARARVSEAKDRYDDLENGIDPQDQEIARAQVEIAEAHMALAKARKDQVQPRVQQVEAALTAAEAASAATLPALRAAEAGLAAAEAGLAAAEATLEAAEAGLVAAEANVVAAQAEIERAEAELKDNELRAPWEGTIANLELKENEYITPGQTVLSIADFSGWVVETDNLTEIEVPEVSVGQQVTITPDALPELILAGEVVSIASLYDEKRGDVTYTVTLDLAQYDPRLRWGMTVVVNFASSG